jgi:hypothetical protein
VVFSGTDCTPPGPTDDDKDAKKGKSLAGVRHGKRGGHKTYAAKATAIGKGQRMG